MNPLIQPTWDSQRHHLIWNHPLLLHTCDIPCSIHPPQPILPLGEPGHCFDFNCQATGLTICYNQQPVLKLGGGSGSHLHHPVQFRGRFQFYTLSHHFFWKWKNLKIRLKCYYHLPSHALFIRLDLKSSTRIKPFDSSSKQYMEDSSPECDHLRLDCHPSAKFYPQRHFYPFTRKTFEPELDICKVEMTSASARGQMMMTIPVPNHHEDWKTPPDLPTNFKQEDTFWVQHTQRSRLLYDQQMIFSEQTDRLGRYLTGLYQGSLYNTDYSQLAPLSFIHLREGRLSFSRPDPALGHRVWFMQYYPGQIRISGEFLNREIQKLSIISKGMNSLQIEFPNRRYRLIDATTDQTLFSHLDDDILDLSFADRHAFYIDRI